MEQKKLGPFSYENWKASSSGETSQAAFEYPLFSDAHIVGEITSGIGPYQIINAVPIPRPYPSRFERPSLVLRIRNYIEYKTYDMDRTKDERYHGGFEADEIASIISLCLGIRLKAGGASRVFEKDGDPLGRPMGGWYSEDPPLISVLPKMNRAVLKSALGEHNLKQVNILSSLPCLSVENAIALVRAARMYQEAIWIIEATPELSWIMLVSAVETVASQWRNVTESPVEKMRFSRPDLETILQCYGGDKADELIQKVADSIAQYMGAGKTFRDFLIRFLPPPSPRRPPLFAQLSWDTSAMEKAIKQIYTYRSKALHGGRPFPAPMCEPPANVGEHGELAEIPLGLATSMKGGVWLVKDTPMLLHTFEYIVRNAILNWWRSIAPTGDSSTTNR